jgi:hypothetical protein
MFRLRARVGFIDSIVVILQGNSSGARGAAKLKGWTHPPRRRLDTPPPDGVDDQPLSLSASSVR